MVGLALLCAAAWAGEQGIEIVPGDEGVFIYEDDYSTPRVFQEAFLTNTGPEIWASGVLSTSGPNRRRTVTYRFYAPRPIASFDLTVEQEANKRNLGGRNYLYLSTNGVDWDLVATSVDLEGDATHWQRDALKASGEVAAPYLGKREIWVRLMLDNNSGLKTGRSNSFLSLKAAITLSEDDTAASDPMAALRKTWGELRRATAWNALAFDWRDPAACRAPYYYEDVDGWLVKPTEIHEGAPGGFAIIKQTSHTVRPVTGLGLYVRTGAKAGPVMARLSVLTGAKAFRELAVFWDGAEVAVCDTAGFFEEDRDFLMTLATSPKPGVHEIRISPKDAGRVAIQSLVLAGEPLEAWAEKPAMPAGGSLEVLSAYYMPDPAPPVNSQTVEGRKKPDVKDISDGVGLTFKGMQRLYQEHAEFGAVRMVVRNNGSVPVRIANPVLLNGTPVEESFIDFVSDAWDAPGVVWHRVRPRSLEPGECAQAYIRFRRHPEGEAARVTLLVENGAPVSATIPYTGAGVSVDYVSTSEDHSLLYVYARRAQGSEPGDLTGISLDGVPLASARVFGADYPGGVALAVVQLDKPLVVGDYHIAAIHTAGKRTVAAQFRVVPFMFPRSSIHVPSELCKPMHMNLGMWWMRSLEDCLKHDIYSSAMHADIFGVHERVAYIIGPDEPDAKDNRGGGYDKGLGAHARELADTGWQELVERFDGPTPSWLNMNGTVRPLNWAVYGQYCDINGFDPYPVTYYGADHAYVRESLSISRQCCAPTPMFAILEAFGWSKGQGVPSKIRGPEPVEYRQNVVQSIGSGMKGLSSWVYSAGAGGWQLRPDMAEEITKLNQLIEHIEDDLLIGTPVDLASTDAGLVDTGTIGKEHWPKERVWAGAVLCGPDTLVVAVANHIPAQGIGGTPTFTPTKDVTVTVDLPPFLSDVAAFEATENGVAPVSVALESGKAVLKLDSILSGRVFVLRRKK